MEEQVNAEQQEVAINPFASNSWGEEAPQEQQQEVVVIAPEVKEPDTTTNIQTIAEQPNETQPIATTEWFKNYGYESEDVAKTEIESLRKLKDAPPVKEEIKFENEQSKTIHELLRQGKSKEVRAYLETQERLETYVQAEVNDATADEIIKLQMQLKYKDLTPSEIEYKFRKQFSLPKEPTQGELEEESDFLGRKQAWQEQVDDIRMNKIIEAKLAKPELEQQKAKIVLPELEKPQPVTQQPSQESLEAIANVRKQFLEHLESNYSKVEGFTTVVKDESVEIPVSFKIPDEDKVAIKGRLSDFNVEDYITNRWFDEKGNPKIETMMSDIYQLENRDKILSGVANNAAQQRLEEYYKAAKNINLNKTPQQTFQQTQTGSNGNFNPFKKESWSEAPPVLTN